MGLEVLSNFQGEMNITKKQRNMMCKLTCIDTLNTQIWDYMLYELNYVTTHKQFENDKTTSTTNQSKIYFAYLLSIM